MEQCTSEADRQKKLDQQKADEKRLNAVVNQTRGAGKDGLDQDMSDLSQQTEAGVIRILDEEMEISADEMNGILHEHYGAADYHEPGIDGPPQDLQSK